MRAWLSGKECRTLAKAPEKWIRKNFLACGARSSMELP
jgi:hypothetical protein